MDEERAAAKRRASFARTERLAKEARQKTEQTKTEQRRKEERQKTDQQRKAEAVKAAEQRNAQARKRTEQRRLEQENLKKEFGRKATLGQERDARLERQRSAETAKVASQKREVTQDPKRRDAENHVAQQEKRQHGDQLNEHRRQTDRLRDDHKAEALRSRERQAGAIIDHARKIRNIDIAERRELEAFDNQKRSFAGRFTAIVKGAGHFARQEQAIVERHENDRWQKHREHEGKKDQLFWTAQAKRLGQVVERRDMAKAHDGERHALKQAQERTRPQQIEARTQAVARVNDNQKKQKLENVRPAQAFGPAAGQSHEIKR